MNYKKYKPSGVEWIGDIPEHWEVATVGRMCFLGRGRVINSIEIGENSGSYPVYSSQTENDGIMGYLNTYDFEGEYVTWTTDGANAGTVFYRNGKFNCTNVCGTIQPKNWEQIDLKFLPYFLNLGTRFSVRLDINPKLMNNMMAKIPLVLPPKYEQTAIANFLDEKTAKIDSLIEKKKKLIELYKEERTAVINQAVTRGINPNVKLKPSGIDWLGDIPEHWEVKKLKYVAKKISKGTTPSTIGSDLLSEGEIRFLKAENILETNFISKYPEFFIDEETNKLLKRSELKCNDVLIVIAGATIGKVGILTEEFLPANTNQAVCFIRPKEGEMSKWIWLFLQSNYVKQTIQLASVQAAQPNLSMENISKLLFLFPSSDEIEKIIKHIDAETKRIDEKIKRTEKEIELLQEYRTALISEVVTGKIKIIDN